MHSELVRILPHYTYDDYLHWEGRWEVIDGIPYAMSPAPLPRHQIVSVNIASAFNNSLKNKSCKVYFPIDYMISDDTILQPDILITCKEIVKNFLDFPPFLIVEILSSSTLLKDRYTKYWLYEKQLVKYYVIIDAAINEAEVYLLNDKSYQLQQKGKNFSFTFSFDDCTAFVNFGEIW